MNPSDFLSLFLPLFVAMDPLGVLPAFVQMTSNLSPVKRRRITDISVLTAGGVGLLFIPLGPMVLKALGLRMGDFQVAGGLLVLVVALGEIVWESKLRMVKGGAGAGVVPIGIPLLVGPAVFATLILLQDRFSWYQIASALLLNLFLAWLFFRKSSNLMGWMGVTGAQVVSKLAALLLSAYAVMMIRVGLSSLK